MVPAATWLTLLKSIWPWTPYFRKLVANKVKAYRVLVKCWQCLTDFLAINFWQMQLFEPAKKQWTEQTPKVFFFWKLFSIAAFLIVHCFRTEILNLWVDTLLGFNYSFTGSPKTIWKRKKNIYIIFHNSRKK